MGRRSADWSVRPVPKLKFPRGIADKLLAMRRAGALTIVCLLALVLPPAAAQAVTYTVNTTADVAGSPGCTPVCSLRRALNEAQGQTEVKIQLPAKPESYAVQAGTPLPVTDTQVTIEGLGAGSEDVTITAPDHTEAFAIDSAGGGVEARLQDLSITHLPGDLGRAIRATGTGDNVLNLVLIDADIVANTAPSAGGAPGRGGGIEISTADETPTFLGLNHVRLAGNVAEGGSSGPGDGGAGGGLYAANTSVALTATDVLENEAAAGAHAGGRGGGLYLDHSALRFVGGSVEENVARGFADPTGDASAGGGIYYDFPESAAYLRMFVSTVANNRAEGAAGALRGGRGGGIEAIGPVYLTNTTVADNTAGGAVGVSGHGGGLTVDRGLLHFVSSTIADNEAAGAGGTGGNLLEHESPLFSFVNTIISGGIAAGGDQNCERDATPARGGVNIENLDTCGLNAAAGDLVDTDPQLGPLAENPPSGSLFGGGDGKTMAIGLASPAHDAATNCVPPSNDERGVRRPQGLACDVGAYELEAASPDLSAQTSPTVALGGGAFDTATLTGGAAPTGQITFQLFGPDGEFACSEAPVFSDTVTVSGGGTYRSAAFTPTLPGHYQWFVEYGGDHQNNRAHADCGLPDSELVVTPAVAGGKVVSGGSTTGGSKGGGPAHSDHPVSLALREVRSAKGGRAILTVAVSGPGTVSVRQRLPKSKRRPGSRLVKSLSRQASAAGGALTLTVRPTAAARRLLKRQPSVTVPLEVAFATPGGVTATVATSVVLKSG